MILGKTRIALNLLEEIGIATHIGIGQSQRFGCLTIFGSRHQIQIFIDRVYTKLTIVAQARISQLALGCGNNDDTRSTTRTILSRLRSILQDGETLNIARSQRIEHRHISKDAIDDNQRVVTT